MNDLVVPFCQSWRHPSRVLYFPTGTTCSLSHLQLWCFVIDCLFFSLSCHGFPVFWAPHLFPTYFVHLLSKTHSLVAFCKRTHGMKLLRFLYTPTIYSKYLIVLLEYRNLGRKYFAIRIIFLQGLLALMLLLSGPVPFRFPVLVCDLLSQNLLFIPGIWNAMMVVAAELATLQTDNLIRIKIVFSTIYQKNSFHPFFNLYFYKIRFKLHTILNIMMKSHPVLLCPGQNVNHPFVHCIHSVHATLPLVI